MGRYQTIAVLAAVSGIVATTGAEAYVCARGPVRAGCVSRYGAVGVRRGPYVRGGAVVVRHPFHPYRRGVVVVR